MLLVVPLYVCRPFCPKNLKLLWKEDPKKRKIRCRYNWTMSKNKELFQFAGKKKTPDFLPNGFAGTVFGQGLPPVKVNWKKNRRNWQRHQFDFFIRAWKIAISHPIFIVKTTFTPQQTPNKVLNKTCLLYLGAPSNPIWDICRQSQKIPIFALPTPRFAFLVNKVVDLGKTSAGQSSYNMSRRLCANFQQNLLEIFQNRLNLPPSCLV